MLQFRTILLWLAFVLLILQYFVDIRFSIALGIAFRLTPSALLLLWFLLALFFREKLKIDPANTPRPVLMLFRILRPLSSASIVAGAIFKLLHLPYGNLLLITGIGFMATYSTLLSVFAYEKPADHPDIIDDADMHNGD